MFEDYINQIWNAPNWALCTISDTIHDITGFRCQFDNGIPLTSRRVSRVVSRGVPSPGRAVTRRVSGRVAPTRVTVPPASRTVRPPTNRTVSKRVAPVPPSVAHGATGIARNIKTRG